MKVGDLVRMKNWNSTLGLVVGLVDDQGCVYVRWSDDTSGRKWPMSKNDLIIIN